jgi:hypothetical protein
MSSPKYYVSTDDDGTKAIWVSVGGFSETLVKYQQLQKKLEPYLNVDKIEKMVAHYRKYRDLIDYEFEIEITDNILCRITKLLDTLDILLYLDSNFSA